MAISGIISDKFPGPWNHVINFRWGRRRASSSEMTSYVHWEISVDDKSIFDNWDAVATYYILKIDTQEFTGRFAAVGTSGWFAKGSVLLAEGDIVIKHTDANQKTCSVELKTAAKPADTGTATLNGIMTLDGLTRGSNITCTTVNIGDTPVITIDSISSDYVHTLSYGFGDQEHGYITGTIVEKTKARQINDFDWPEEFYQVIPNSTGGIGTIFCDTYTSTGREVGQQTRCNFVANVNEGSSTPIFDYGYPKIRDKNGTTIALTGDANKLIRYASDAFVDIGAKGRNYATIARQKVKNGTAYHEEYTNDLVSIGFGRVTSGLFSFELEDSRGYISKPGRDLGVAGRFIEYFLPTCHIGNEKPDTHGNLTIKCNGSWFNSSFGAVDNTITAQYRYRLEHSEWEDAESEWQPMPITISGNNYEATVSFAIPDFDYLAGYVYEARVIDKLYTVNSSEYKVKSAAIFSWSNQDFEFNVPVKFNAGAEGLPGGSGEGTGDLSQYALKSEIPTVLPNPYALTINGQTYDGTRAVAIEGGGSDLASGGTIDGDLTITGDLRLKGDGNYGNTIYFGDGSYASMSEPTDDALTIKATSIKLNGTVYVNGTSIDDFGGTTGTWTPSLDSSAISTYSIRQGWYQKVGNVVTIGFTVKAACNLGYNNTAISISGLPFTPRYDASGGGICAGATVSGGFNFECWVASTSNTITARVQACNNTSSGILSTSASGLFYRGNGGEITLGGTICYITN